MKVLLLLLLFVADTSFAATRLGLHVTQEEVNIWKQRAASGPYKTQWDTIKSRADSFVSAPPAMWTARTTGGCWNFNGGDTTPGRSLDRELRDAGLMYLVTGASSYRDAVRSRLLSQIAVAGTNFATNTSVWCSSNNFESRYFEIANWVRRLVYGYDYIRSSLSGSDISAIDAWLLGAANHFDNGMNITIGYRFSGRLSDNYTCTGGSTFCPGGARGLLYFGGPTAYVAHDGWNNILATGGAVVAAIGIQQNNATLKDRAKRFFTEWLKYAVLPGNIPMDQYRWNGANAQVSYLYVSTVTGTMITIADHFARAGDTSLYDMTTEGGYYGSETPGSPKSLLKVMQHEAGLVLGTLIQYASTTSTTNAALVIDPYSGSAENYITFVSLAPGNLYYNDTSVKNAYQATIPASQGTGDYDALGGEWGEYPAALGMFGLMEGVVNPYVAGTPNVKIKVTSY